MDVCWIKTSQRVEASEVGCNCPMGGHTLDYHHTALRQVDVGYNNSVVMHTGLISHWVVAGYSKLT